ncbi:MAG: hypothetical protein U0235_16345 [Polyangiaceae bacterium]
MLQTVFVEYNKELEKKQKELTDPIVEEAHEHREAHRHDRELRSRRGAPVRPPTRASSIYLIAASRCTTRAARLGRRAAYYRQEVTRGRTCCLRPSLAALVRDIGGELKPAPTPRCAASSPDQAGEGDVAPVTRLELIPAALEARARVTRLLVDARVASRLLAIGTVPHVAWAMAAPPRRDRPGPSRSRASGRMRSCTPAILYPGVVVGARARIEART